MAGYIWHIVTFVAIGISLAAIVYRTVSIVRMPVHLRWELAPIPHEKGRGHYGGSYLEDHEWWRKSRRKSRMAPLVYMLREIFTFRSILKHNQGLWPYTMLLHYGIYFVIFSVFLNFLNALLVITAAPLSVLYFFQGLVTVFSASGFILGTLGVIFLILKRALDADYQPFSTTAVYFNLIFLGAIFISGAYARFSLPDFTASMSVFIKNMITLDASVALTVRLSLHIGLSLLFLIYLPMSDMAHFFTKYFTYHGVRWDDRPQDIKMQDELRGLITQQITWSAGHIDAGTGKSWNDTATNSKDDEKEP
jgi:nitrate reductase gamma subunit